MNPPDDDGSDGDCGHEDVGAAVITGCDTPPILEPPEHVFYLMALFVLDFAKYRRVFPTLARWNAGGDAFCFEGGAILIGIVTLVSDQRRAGPVSQGWVQDLGTDVVGNLSRRKAHRDRATLAIANGMQLGIQSALCAADMAGKNPPFMRLDAVR